MARGLVLILLSCPLFAQFSFFVATDDGRQMYFTSSLPLAGDPPGVAGSRIFRLTGNALEPFAGSGDSAASGAYNPQVSGDGQTVGLTRNGNAELLGVGVNVPGPGLLTLSRNARWAVLTVTTIMPPPINSYPGPYPGPITGGFCTYSGSGRNGGFTWNAPAPATPQRDGRPRDQRADKRAT